MIRPLIFVLLFLLHKPMIYLDNNATTQIAPEVFDAMKPFLTEFYGNASAAYSFSQVVKKSIAASREQVAKLLGAAETAEIVFTSGGTEADNWAILSALEANPDKNHLVISSVEHEAVYVLCEKLEKHFKKISRIIVDEQGNLDLQQLKSSLNKQTAIVSVMLANNETGVIFPVKEIAEIIKEHSAALFHVDGVQAVGKIPLDLKNTEIDLFSVSGHKFNAPKGIGALYIKRNVELPAFFTGGGQEKNRRAGTEAAAQIAGLGAAAELAENFLTQTGNHPNNGISATIDDIKNLRDKLENTILQTIPQTKLNGDKFNRLPNTSNISFRGCEGEAILAHLDAHDVCVSTGSACNSDTHTASRILQAMNVPYSAAMGAIRFSLGKYNTAAEIDFVLEILPLIVQKLREISDFRE